MEKSVFSMLVSVSIFSWDPVWCQCLDLGLMKVLATPAPKERLRGTLQLLDLTGILLRLLEVVVAPEVFRSADLNTSGEVPFQGDLTRGPPAMEVGLSTHMELLIDVDRSSLDWNFSPNLARDLGLLMTAWDPAVSQAFFFSFPFFFTLSNLKSGGNLWTLIACSWRSVEFHDRWGQVGKKHW